MKYSCNFTVKITATTTLTKQALHTFYFPADKSSNEAQRNLFRQEKYKARTSRKCDCDPSNRNLGKHFYPFV